MKIAHVSPYDHQVEGGVREHVENLASQHAAMGCEVRILAPAATDEGLADNVTCLSTTITGVPAARSVARICPSPLVFPRMASILSAARFDVVHIHEPLTPLVGFAALLHADAVTVGTIHGYRPRLSVFRYANPPFRWLLGRLDARVAVSVDARDWAQRYFPGDYEIIPDGVDVQRFAEPGIRPVEAFDDDRPTVLFVGRLEARKGLPHLLDAFPTVQAAVPGARLVVAGHYSDTEGVRWQREAARRGIHDAAFVGRVSAEDLPRYYRTADVFCAPSTGFEALGIVLLEAMASGTPVVTTDIEGYRTVVRDGVEARVVPPRDSTALAEALIAVLKDDALRTKLVEAGRRRVEDYAWPTLAARLLDLYRAHGAP